MFVTSDIFDLPRIGRFRGFEWQENLLCGVAVHGCQWPGHERAARFMLEASNRRGLFAAMRVASYKPANAKRSRRISPKSFEKLARGELAGAHQARCVLLGGAAPAPGAQDGAILFGGESSAVSGVDRSLAIQDGEQRAFNASFIFPFVEKHIEAAAEILRLSVNILGSDYGYYFIRDEFCFPGAYPHGISPALDYKPPTPEEAVEIDGWANFARTALWTGDWPLLRDLYEVNLLSERHTAKPAGRLGLITEWITARPGRGRLEDAGLGRMLWILTDAEIFNIRPLLNEAGLLRSCITRVYRDLPGGSPPGAR